MATAPDQFDHGTDEFGIIPWGSVDTEPNIVNTDPVNGSRTLPIATTSVSFDVVDKQSGIDLSSVVVEVSVNGGAYTSVYTASAFAAAWIGSTVEDFGVKAGQEF